MRIAEVILSSFVNLYRNWDDYPFPCRNQEGAYDCLSRGIQVLPEMKLHMVNHLSAAEQEEMLAQGRITKSLLRNQESGAWCSDGEGVTLLWNDTEHIAILSTSLGLALEKCNAAAYEYEKRLASAHPFLRDEQLGYLSSWLPYLGAGMEAGLICHLPCSQESLSKMNSNLNDMEMALEPLLGANAPAHLYRLRYLPTLNTKAEDQFFSLVSVAHQLYDLEGEERENHREEISFQNELWRSYGILAHARLMERDEFLSLWSQLRLGAAMKLLPVSLKKADQLYYRAIPNNLSPEERAELVRNDLKKGRYPICQSSEDSLQIPKKH